MGFKRVVLSKPIQKKIGIKDLTDMETLSYITEISRCVVPFFVGIRFSQTRPISHPPNPQKRKEKKYLER